MKTLDVPRLLAAANNAPIPERVASGIADQYLKLRCNLCLVLADRYIREHTTGENIKRSRQVKSEIGQLINPNEVTNILRYVHIPGTPKKAQGKVVGRMNVRSGAQQETVLILGLIAEITGETLEQLELLGVDVEV